MIRDQETMQILLDSIHSFVNEVLIPREEEVNIAFELGRTSPAFRSFIGTNNGIGSIGILLDGTDISEYAVERFYGDVRLFRLYEGTTQIQQVIISRNMIRDAQQ